MGSILGNVVNKNDAARALVAAVELQAVLDYRDALYENTRKVEDGYIIDKNYTIVECERFFNDVGFVPYRMLRDKVIQFKELVDQLTDEDFKTEESFVCPICGGTVTARMAKKNAIRFHPTSPRYVESKRVACEGCLFKIYI